MLSTSTQNDPMNALAAALDRTSEDRAAWTDACEIASSLVGGVGALIFPANPRLRRPVVPRTHAVDEALHHFASPGWVERDPRGRTVGKALRTGVTTDADVMSADERAQHPYYNELKQFGLSWYAATAVEIGGEVWALSISRKLGDDPFDERQLDTLRGLNPLFAAAGRRAAFLGGRRIDTIEETFSSTGRAVFVLDWAGRIVRVNRRGEEYARRYDLVRAGRFRATEDEVGQRLEERADIAVRYCARRHAPCPPPTSITMPDGAAFVLDAIPLPRDYHSLIANACAIVTLQETASPVHDTAGLLARRFGLTTRESQLAVHLAAGESLSRFAEEHRMSIGTARQHLKATFAKTSTHRQAELAVLIGRLS